MMKKGRRGAYGRDGASIEVMADSSDNYNQLLERSSSAFQLSCQHGGQVLSLFNLSGAIISDSPDWNLGKYLRRIHKTEVRLGIGYIEVG